MGETTGIAWCDHTFNPWIGCTKVSAGCVNCYAERQNKFYRWVNQWGPTGERKRTSEANWRKVLSWDVKAAQATIRGEDTGETPNRPRVFCGSLCDVFEDRSELDAIRNDLWRLIGATPNLDWLLLTKRPENIARMLPKWGCTAGKPRHNVWIGSTAENQEMADKRIPALIEVPAAVRFLSCEPLLGPINLGLLGTCKDWKPVYDKLNWVIVGCESGPNRRPMKLEWALDIVRQCKAAGVACFVKQVPIGGKVSHDPAEWPEELRVQEMPA